METENSHHSQIERLEDQMRSVVEAKVGSNFFTVAFFG